MRMDDNAHEDMMLIDYFAAKFMQARVSDPNCFDEDELIVMQAYRMAEEMMKYRRKYIQREPLGGRYEEDI